jgi:hypothetical protein
VDDNPPQRMRHAALMGILTGAVPVLAAIEVSFG